jgi:hypothetical protein
VALYKNCLMGFGPWGWQNHPQGPWGGSTNFFKKKIVLFYYFYIIFKDFYFFYIVPHVTRDRQLIFVRKM